MADCGKLDYQLIEQVGARALDTAQLLRAEINSIDTDSNTADITLLDTCEALDGIDMSAVPFWYHCEFSSGTLEDLQKGHLAFQDGDMVYALYNSATGSAPAILHVIGHVDIRDTRVCGTSDYILIKETNSTFHSYTYVTVFDVTAGQQLDLGTFVPLDGSPAAPAALPCVMNAAFTAWWDYNFSDPSAPLPVPFTVAEFGEASGPVVTTESWPVNTDNACHWLRETRSIAHPERRISQEYTCTIFGTGGYTWDYELVQEDGQTYTGTRITDGVTSDSCDLYRQYQYLYNFSATYAPNGSDYSTSVQCKFSATISGPWSRTSVFSRGGMFGDPENTWNNDFLRMGGSTNTMPPVMESIGGGVVSSKGNASFAMVSVFNVVIAVILRSALEAGKTNTPYFSGTPCNVITTPGPGILEDEDVVYRRIHFTNGIVSMADSYTGTLSTAGEYSVISLVESADTSKSAGLVTSTEELIDFLQSIYGLDYKVNYLQLIPRTKSA